MPDASIEILRNVYCLLLSLPQGPLRWTGATQALLAASRDALAMAEGRSPEEVQNEYEAKAILENSVREALHHGWS